MSEPLNITGTTDRVSAFVNRVEPFEFEMDGFKVTGEWYKYKTTTPRYQLARQKRLEEITTKLDGIPDKVKDITDPDERQAKRDELEKESERELKEHAFQYYHDLIKVWRDEDNVEIVLSVETFQDLPEPFTQALAAHFKKLRDDAVNPTRSGSSQSG